MTQSATAFLLVRRRRPSLLVLSACALTLFMQRLLGQYPLLIVAPDRSVPCAPPLEWSDAQGAASASAVHAMISDVTESVPSLCPARVALLAGFGIRIAELEPLGAQVTGLDLRAPTPPAEEVLDALQQEMASRGFLAFAGQGVMTAEEQIRASELWGGREMHSTHAEHPDSPSRHILRIANDPEVGCVGVGPGWHNDGSFELDVFSHVGYHIVRVPEQGGNTLFAHQAVAFAALPEAKRERWSRLVSVNSNTGALHPVVHRHPITGRPTVFLHLAMTGAVIEALPQEQRFRLLDDRELHELLRDYHELLEAGIAHSGGAGCAPYAVSYAYREGDCLFVDNLAVAHHASKEAHVASDVQGLRILHRTTVRAMEPFLPGFGLPRVLNIIGPRPWQFTSGVWCGGNAGFCWDPDHIAIVPDADVRSYR